MNPSTDNCRAAIIFRVFLVSFSNAWSNKQNLTLRLPMSTSQMIEYTVNSSPPGALCRVSRIA
jgi:hypothetical protein